MDVIANPTVRNFAATRKAGPDVVGDARRLFRIRSRDTPPGGPLLQGWCRSKGAPVNEENAALLRRAWAAYDRGDAEGFAACLTDDWREHTPTGEVATLEDERKTMAAHLVAFPDKHTEILHLVADGDMVAIHSTTTAVHRGPYLGLTPTGTRVSVDEMMFSRIEHDKIAETWVITAGPGFYRQLTGSEAPEDLDNMG